MSALAVVVDACDWTIDALRKIVGLPPLPPALVKLAFVQPLAVRIPGELKIETRRAIYSFLRVVQDELI